MRHRKSVRGVAARRGSHPDLAERGRKKCGCRQCADKAKHPCSTALWAASIALELLEEESP